MTFYVDGSYGQTSAICVATSVKNRKIKVVEGVRNAKHAEYLALLECLRECNPEAVIYTDSKVLLNEVNGGYTESFLYDYLTEILNLLKEKPKVEIRWIRRDLNCAGMALDLRLLKLKFYSLLSSGCREDLAKQIIRRRAYEWGLDREIVAKWLSKI